MLTFGKFSQPRFELGCYPNYQRGAILDHSLGHTDENFS